MIPENTQQIIDAFQLDGTLIYCSPFGEGHINTTQEIHMRTDSGSIERFVLQEINTNIFKDPEALSNNIQLVTEFIKQEIFSEGGNPDREALTLIPTKEHAYYLEFGASCYRVYKYIEGASCYQQATPELFYESAKAFGKFAKQLDNFDATLVVDTIPNFHNTVDRFKNFQNSVTRDSLQLAEKYIREIRFVQEREAFCSTILDAIESGTIPLRVCHNDTKLNNVMIDDKTMKGICVIDLDTVMQGTLLYDFGDSIRFGASSAAEDEESLDLVYCDLDKYDLFTKGYIEECHSILSPNEVTLLPQAAILMTLECGMRFFADFLDGDTYFKIHKPNHNLYRARNQFKLVWDMEQKLEEMTAIAESYYKQYSR
ncbi:MAG: aminoglycoside phosphotransferase family protein [Eubacteriales bacterium]